MKQCIVPDLPCLLHFVGVSGILVVRCVSITLEKNLTKFPASAYNLIVVLNCSKQYHCKVFIKILDFSLPFLGELEVLEIKIL